MTTDEKHAELKDTIARLEGKRDEYEERLDIGAAKIDTAREAGQDVTAWEAWWCKLLREYENICNKQRELSYQLNELQPVQG